MFHFGSCPAWLSGQAGGWVPCQFSRLTTLLKGTSLHHPVPYISV